MITYILIGLLSAGITLFLNYCIGSPASEKFSPYEIFSNYTVWLSKMRLKQVQILDTYTEQYHDNLKRITTLREKINLDNDFRKILYEAAEPFFTWERAAGMCPVCTGVWIAFLSYLTSLFVELSYSPPITLGFILDNLLSFIIIIVVSHITIRLLNKIL